MSGELAVKITDGLYVGVTQASRDETHITLNKVELIVAFGEVRPYFAHYGIRYESVRRSINQQCWLLSMIDQVRQEGVSVLIYSDELGQPLALAGAYLMRRYQWGLFKVIEFLISRAPDCQLSKTACNLMKEHQSSLLEDDEQLSHSWKVKPRDCSQLTMRNTFLNSQNRGNAQVSTEKKVIRKQKPRIKWNIAQVSPLKVKQQAPNSDDKRRQKIMKTVRSLIKQDSKLSLKQLQKHKSSQTLRTISTVTSHETMHNNENDNFLNGPQSKSKTHNYPKLKKTYSSVLRPLGSLN